MKVEFTENGIHATMNSSYNGTKESNSIPLKWTKSLIWGAISILLSCFSIGLGLIGGLGNTWVKSWSSETYVGIAFLTATIISFVLVGISILASILSICAFIKQKADQDDAQKLPTNEVAGIGCSVIAILICIVCIIFNIYWLLL